jgi:anti-sigma regulatory factor (Ser/Thr protein kinase)
LRVRRTRIELPADAAAVGEARRAVASFEGIAATMVGDAQLVVSELVTNALLHAGLGPGDTISLTLWRDGDLLRIEVDDHGGFDGRAVEERLGTASGGMGLRIVDTLAVAWEAGAGRVSACVTA